MIEHVHKPEIELEARVYELVNEGKLQEAAEACDSLNREFPSYASGWYTASMVALRVQQPQIALQSINVALRLSPGQPEWVLRKLVCLGAVGDIESARAVAMELDGVRFDTAHQATNCGLSLNQLGFHAEAEAHFRRALELDPDNSTCHYNLATALRLLGRLDEAREALDRAIELNPDDFESYVMRSSLQTQDPDSNNVDSLVAALDRLGEDDRGRVPLYYSLAKELEDIEDYDRSFDYLEKGATARRASLTYRLGDDLEMMRMMRKHYSKDVFESDGQGFVNAEPIFIIGLPRTGILLVDRILGAHSVVRATPEARTFAVEGLKHCALVKPEIVNTPAELVPASLRLNLTDLGEDYVASARPAANLTAHFIDKRSQNFVFAGLIHRALPKAKIVWLQRDPMDTCYAIYKTLFKEVYEYSYDLQELATYYVAYDKLMAHWREVMPGAIHVVQYEDLVQDSRPVIEALLDYCHLGWEEGCLRYQQTGGPGGSASSAQLRQELHRRSIGKWRCYEKQLQPVYDILEEGGVFARLEER